MTTTAMQGDRQECLAAGMNDYLTKPIRVDALVAALQGVTHRGEVCRGFVPAMQPPLSGCLPTAAEWEFDTDCHNDLPCDAQPGARPSLHDLRDTMVDANQTFIARSFIDLFIPPGSYKPREPRDIIAARYELCEDMAQMLTEHARMKLLELGVSEEDVLDRVHRGLRVEQTVVTEYEARWINCRLAELLGWPMPHFGSR